MRIIPTAALLAFASAATCLAADSPAAGAASAAAPASLTGQLAFSQTMEFDYDRDGKQNRVQFWIDLEGRPVVTASGQPAPKAESGSVRYFVLDVDTQRRIDDWLLGMNMGEGFPVAGEPYAITGLTISGNTAQFDLRGSKWTIVDRGTSWEDDSIEIVTGGRKRQGRFYGGDLKVTPGAPRVIDASGAGDAKAKAARAASKPRAASRPLDAASMRHLDPPREPAGLTPRKQLVSKPVENEANRRCNNCHEDAAVSMAADGGPHAKLKCAACHAEHPKDVPGAVPQCAKCHDGHGKAIPEESCSTCHSSHAYEAIRYDVRVPDAHCSACHRKAATRLRESNTMHMGIPCVVCHRTEHGAMPTCTHCHGAPHSAPVMAEPKQCVRCHESAHETRIWP